VEKSGGRAKGADGRGGIRDGDMDGGKTNLPEDIFTEPDPIDPDTLANLGPLRPLAGIWEGMKGADLNPKADGPERKPYYERIELQPIDPQTNGPQLFYGLRYHTHITTPGEDITFHDQVGHWLWEPATGLILQSLSIPRAQTALAAGHAAPGDRRLVLSAARGRTDYGICSTTFLEAAFRTDSYRIEIEFHADGRWSYVSETSLLVKGRDAPFIHRDHNLLTKVAEPDPNPWMKIIQRAKTAPPAG
jgi:hypothetical protein